MWIIKAEGNKANKYIHFGEDTGEEYDDRIPMRSGSITVAINSGVCKVIEHDLHHTMENRYSYKYHSRDEAMSKLFHFVFGGM